MGATVQNGWFTEDNQSCDKSQKSTHTFRSADHIYSLYNSVTDWQIMGQIMSENWLSSVAEWQSPLNLKEFLKWRDQTFFKGGFLLENYFEDSLI